MVVALLTASGCLHSPSPVPLTPVKQEEAVIEGDTVEVAMQNWPYVVQVQGTLFADEVATVGSNVSGRIVEVLCDLGDQVELEQVLVKIDTAEYKLLAAQAEAQLSQARSAVGLKADEPVEKLNPLNAPPVREAAAVLDETRQAVMRLEKLFAQGAVVATDLEVAQSAETVAEARYNSALNSVREKIALIGVQSAMRSLAQERLLETTIVAPFKGMVQRRNVAVGSYVNVGQPILELVRTSVLRYRAAVPERLAASLRIGQRVRIKVIDQESREVAITRISPTLDPVSRSLTFEALVPNEEGRLRSGSFAQAEVVLDEQSQALAIPSSAVVRFAGVDKVWQIKDGKVTEAVIQMGREERGMIEVLGGLEPGSLLLADGTTGRVGRFQSATPASQAANDSPANTTHTAAPNTSATPSAALHITQAIAPEENSDSSASVALPKNSPAPSVGDSTPTDDVPHESAAAGSAIQPGLGR